MESCEHRREQGVDLNRNYGFEFAHNDEGSHNEPCVSDYRGPNAFSEPETQAMRDLVTKYSNIKIAINFHAWGPLFIIPFNVDGQSNI